MFPPAPEPFTDDIVRLLLGAIYPPEVLAPVTEKVLVLCVVVKAAPAIMVIAPPEELILAPLLEVMRPELIIATGPPAAVSAPARVIKLSPVLVPSMTLPAAEVEP